MALYHDTDDGPCECGAWHIKKTKAYVVFYQYYENVQYKKAFFKKSDALLFIENYPYPNDKRNMYIMDIEIE